MAKYLIHGAVPSGRPSRVLADGGDGAHARPTEKACAERVGARSDAFWFALGASTPSSS